MIDFDALVLGPCMAAFGSSCAWLPAGRVAPVPFTGVFEEFHISVRDGADGMPVEDTRPIVGCQAAAFPREPANEELVQTSDGRWWQIDSVDADGIGHLKLNLKTAANGMPA